MRLDKWLTEHGLTATRSQAESYIRMGQVRVNGVVVTKPGSAVPTGARVNLELADKYVSRAGHKLASVAAALGVSFRGRVVLDVGSSTGGFTDYALQQGAQRVIAVDVGSRQLHPSLRSDSRIDLHEQTDIRDVQLRPTADAAPAAGRVYIDTAPDIIVIDVSFISLRDLLPHIRRLASFRTVVLAMVKPQFEAGNDGLKHKGVIKNERMRRTILQSFEAWSRQQWVIVDKADSQVAGSRGNLERFYLLKPSRTMPRGGRSGQKLAR
ncbi:TlyA family rRNA (cytidine-2'-O)-methyltransferase [Candidatus Saccharibacteria bacterium]|nr:MAG: TlyA family rRNA (cytidine-2'-O)-methyltransferase [Candidatus Saccharibacteria bacterium]